MPSGKQKIINNRITWARIYMQKAKLMESPRRSSFRITEQGLKILENKPSRIDIKFLKTIPEFKAWQTTFAYQSKKEISEASQSTEEIETQKTPEELLDYSFAKLKEELATELIEKIKSCSPRFFEQLVIDLLIQMGYGGSKKEAGQIIGKSGDGGIDGIIKEDKLGLDTIYVQAKKWNDNVPISQIIDFAGSLLSKKARKGIFISTSGYPKGAYDFDASLISFLL